MGNESNLSEEAILAELGRGLAARRVAMGFTQAELARQAGIGKRTVERIEAGNACQTSALVRVLGVLELQGGFRQLFLPSGPRPMDLLRFKGKTRKRASSRRRGTRRPDGPWTWGDEA
jgi:DNA-binding XRE family transcriptional regulator